MSSQPEPYSIDDIRQQLHAISDQLTDLIEHVAYLTQSHNQIGENVAWLVANTQGIFKMLSDPQMINSMMSGVLAGGLPGMGGEKK